MAVVSYRGDGALMEKYGTQFPKKPLVCDLEKTIDALGFQPKYNFDTFLAELKKRDEANLAVS